MKKLPDVRLAEALAVKPGAWSAMKSLDNTETRAAVEELVELRRLRAGPPDMPAAWIVANAPDHVIDYVGELTHTTARLAIEVEVLKEQRAAEGLKTRAEIEARIEESKQLIKDRPGDSDRKAWHGEIYGLEWALGMKTE